VKRTWAPFLQAFWLLFLGHLLAFAVANTVPFLFGPFWYGLAYASLLAVRGGAPSTQELFSGFARFAGTFLLGFILFLFCAVPAVVASLLGSGPIIVAMMRGNQPAMMGYTMVFGLVALLPTLIIVILYSPAFFILADRPELTAWEAMEASRRMVWRNLSAWRNLYGAVALLHLAGLAACCVGFFVVMPWTVVIQALAYDIQLKAEAGETTAVSPTPTTAPR